MTLLARENPARPSECVGEVELAGPEQVDRAVRAAAAAQPDWERRGVAERAQILALAWPAGPDPSLLARELGKVAADCAGELGFSAMVVRWCCEHAPSVLAEQALDDPAGRLTLAPRPFGVVAALTPWNAPVVLSVLKLAPALLAGNTVVVKPSPLAPLTVDAVLGELAAALPPGVVALCHGGAQTGAALVEHPLVAKIAFTGGGATGSRIAAAAGARLTPVLLELGGNDPAIVLEDAELTPAALERLLVATFATTGQVCMAVKRIYVHASRQAELVEGLQAVAATTLRVGDPLDPQVSMGPLVTAAAAERVAGLVAQAERGGGRRVDLGEHREHDPAGYFLTPTLVLDPPADCPLVVEEQFGPSVPVLGFTDLDHVVAQANAGPLGLGASVWSADEDRAFAVAARLEAGFRFVNTHNRAGLSLRAPFGGVKQSGFGREYGEEGLREYAQTCVVHAPASARGGAASLGSAAAYPAS